MVPVVLVSAFFLSCFPASVLNCVTENEFDFVVVGAGTTGSVVVARLSELLNAKILVLEAGVEPLHVSEIPLVAFKAMGSSMDWNYTTVPQETCCRNYKTKKVLYPRGKALGGTSSINFMAYTRGNRLDFDDWRDLGNDGWGYDDLFPYFMKMEDYRPPTPREHAAYHNHNGPMTVEIPPFKTVLADAFLQAGAETGQPLVDYNGKYQTGFMYPPVTTRDGARCSTYRAYLEPAMQRGNVFVETGALVTKVIFDANKVAVGLNYEKDGEVCQVKATTEVILSAGAINSPQLLMLSGVGPKEHLKKFNIPLVHDLPGVGQNLQDHLTLGGLIYTLDQKVSLNSVRYETKEQEEIWEETRTGPMTVPISFEGIAFYKTNATDGPEDWSDLEIYLNTDNTGRVFKPILIPEAVVSIPADHIDAMTFHPILLRPKSRGTVTLSSSNPRDPPLIDPRYLSHPQDVAVMIEALGIVQRLAQTKAFSKFGAKPAGNGLPFAPCVASLKSGGQLEYAKCLVLYLSSTGFHPSSTCKMGPEWDSMSVVDSKLRVYGVKNLRVADASIMPNVVAGHPQAACMVIGEKISDEIKLGLNGQ